MIPLMFNSICMSSTTRERVAEKAIQQILDGYMGRAPIVAGNLLGVLLEYMHEKAPGISESELRTKLLPGIYEGMERAEARVPKTHGEMRSIIADLKLLCLSEVFDSLLMWAHYGKDHTGVVIELSCVESIDSAWGAARPIRYLERMPLLIDEDQLFKLMTGEGGIGEQDVFANSVFVKAAEWAYEKEWRLVGGRDGTKNFEDFSFAAEEVSAVYLGCRASNDDAACIRGIVENMCIHMQVYTQPKRRSGVLHSNSLRLDKPLTPSNPSHAVS
jgi:hypothetical protein